MTNGLVIAEGLITLKDEASRTFSIVLININDCDVNLSDRTVLSTVQRIVVAESIVIYKDSGKEIRDNVSKFLKKDVSQGDVLINDVVSITSWIDGFTTSFIWL